MKIQRKTNHKLNCLLPSEYFEDESWIDRYEEVMERDYSDNATCLHFYNYSVLIKANEQWVKI